MYYPSNSCEQKQTKLIYLKSWKMLCMAQDSLKSSNQPQNHLNKNVAHVQKARKPKVLFTSFFCLFVFLIFGWAGSWLLCSVQFSSVAQSCPTLWNPMNRSMPGLPVHHQFPELTQIHVHRVSDAIQPSHPLSSPSPPAPNPSQSLFQGVNSSHEVAKVLEFQL